MLYSLLVAAALWAASFTSSCTGGTCTLDASSTTGGTPSSYKWTFHDGRIVPSTTPKVTVTYSAVGTYKVILIVTFTNGLKSSFTGYVKVTAPTPPPPPPPPTKVDTVWMPGPPPIHDTVTVIKLKTDTVFMLTPLPPQPPPTGLAIVTGLYQETLVFRDTVFLGRLVQNNDGTWGAYKHNPPSIVMYKIGDYITPLFAAQALDQ